jgi:N utilization substance protein B
MNKPHHRRQDGVDPVLRTRARRRALQAVYAWQLSGATARDIVTQFAHEQAREIADLAYFEDLVHGVETHLATLDAALAPHLDRTIDEVDPIERAALRIAAYEFARRQDVPYRVVINEALESVKRFGSEHGHTYVNGVLDHLAADLRAVEMQAAKGQ